MRKKIKVLVVDDSPIFCYIIKDALSCEEDIEIIGVARRKAYARAKGVSQTICDIN